MIAKLAKIVLSIVAGMLGLVLVMMVLAGAGPVGAMEDIGQDGGGALAAGLPVTPVTVEMAAFPTEIRADGYSHSTITGTVKDSGGFGVSGAFIAFTTTLGTIDQYCYAEAEGASVNKSPGDWAIENYSGASGEQYVWACGTVSPLATLTWTFGASAISMLYVKGNDGGIAEVWVDTGTPITVDMCGTGMAERVITAGLGAGSHIVTVKWLTQSCGSCIRVDAFRCGTTTNASGQATATLTSTLLSCGSKDATVTAIAGAPLSPTLTGTKLVKMTASAPNSVTVTANPNRIVADRTSTSTLEATVRDQFGQSVPDCTMVGFLATDEDSAAPGEAWVTLPYKLVEGENPTKVITNGWSITSNVGYHGGQAIYTNTAGATARWNFTGTAVSLIYPKLSDAGVATVTVDSGLPITIDMYAPSPQYQVEHVITHALSPGPHVITVTVAGYTVTGGTDTRVYVDAFRSGVSTSGGKATAVLTAGTKAGVVMVEATAVGRPCCDTNSVVSGIVPITLTAGDPYTLTITPADVSITCCMTSTLQFTVTDRYDNQVGLVVPRILTVDFTSKPYGVFTPTSVVVTNGAGSVIFHAWTAGSGAITGTVRGYPVTDTSKLTVTPASCYTLTVIANPTQIYVTDENTSLLPNFRYTSTITAELRDRCNNPVQDGTLVTFTTSLGEVGPANPTTINGIATAVLTSAQLANGVPTQTAYITVTGASCPVSGTTTVIFGRHVYTLTVTAIPDKIKVGGYTSTIAADVRDGFGGPTPDGVTVTFAISPALATVSPETAKTLSGKATVTATSKITPGVATIEAVAIGSTVTNTGLITITAGDPYTLTITPTDVSITCCMTSTLQFTVTDQYSNIVGAVIPATVTVNFTSTPYGVFTPTSSVVVTKGVGSVIFHGYQAGTGIIEGRVAGVYPRGVDTSTLTVSAGSPATLTVTRAPTSILADGSATATITATVRDACQNPVCNRIVTFTTDLGSFSPPPTTTLSITKTTNCSGVATATLRSEYISRRANITVTVDSLIGTTYVDMVGVAWDVQLEANPTNIPVGGYTSTLTATVKDQFGHAVVDGTVVTFTTSLGSLGSSTTTKTTSGGIAKAVLTSSNTVGTATITATAGSGTYVATDTVTVTFRAGPPYAVTLVAYPMTLTVGNSSSLTATVKDQYNNNVADGTVVTFTTSLGSVGSISVTKMTTNGIATATLTSQVAGTALVTATADTKYGTTNVTFQPGLPYTLTLVAYPITLTVDHSATLTATAKDQYNNPVADGTVVTFTTSLGSVGSISVTKMTTNGIATATLTSQLPGTATITATAGLTSATTTVFFKAGLPYTVTLQAYPTSIPVAGYTSTLTATVKDKYNNNVANGTVVTFATSLGNLGGLPITKTTIGGMATAILTSETTAGTAIVTATSDSQVATTTVRFMPLSPYTVTLVAYPTSLRVGNTSTLTVTAKDQYNNNVADGTVVTFETSLGSLGSMTVTKTTTNGVALAALTSQIPGTATITATTDSKVVTTAVEFRPGLPYTITLVASPMSLTVGNTSSLTATVKDQYNNDVADGTVVTFTTSLGSLGSTPLTRTTVSGVATATLTSQVAGTAVVTATSDSKYGTVNVTFNPDLPYTMTVEAYPTSIPIGWFTSTITATVKDQYANPVADGTGVTFATDLGSLGSSSVTKFTKNGVATATLTSGLIIGTANISATCGSLIRHTQVIFTKGEPFTVTVESWPPTIEVGGKTATITATVTDIGGYAVADGTAVVFTTDLGSLGSSTVTKYTTNGIAVATLTSGLTPGVAHITVTAGSKSDTAIVKIAAGPPSSIHVTANPTFIPIGGATSLITATVKDQHGNNVINGTIVNFATTLGSVSPESAATNEGIAVTTLTSEVTMGTARVTASSGEAVGSVDVVFTVGPPFYIYVVANPPAIGLNGRTSNIQARVIDVGGNNVADGTLVTFATSLGILGSNIVTKTTASGIAAAVLTSQTKAGTAIITATAGSKFNITTVTITPDPPYTVTLSANPVAIPANGISTSRIRARVTDQYGNAVVNGTGCNFYTNLGSISPSFATTLDGVAETTLTAAESPGLATVTATCGGKQGTTHVVFYSVLKFYLPMILKAY
jgi:adhesin/invasin